MQPTRGQKWFFSLGNFGASLTYNSFFTYVSFFYIDSLKMSPLWFAAGFSFFTLWNAVNDPLAGMISDRVRTAVGRRLPFIFWGMLPLALSYALIWSSPFQGQDIRLLFYFLGTIFFFDTFYTFVTLNQLALFSEMFLKTAERLKVNHLRQFFGMAGLMMGVALPPLIYSTLGWSVMGAVFGALALICFFVSWKVSFERPEFKDRKMKPLKEEIRTVFRNRPFLVFVSAYFLIQFSFSLLMAVIPFYSKYVLHAPESHTSFLLAGAILSALVSLYLWRLLAFRLGVHSGMLLAMSAAATALVPFAVINQFLSALAGTVLVGIGLGGILLLTEILLFETIDHDESQNGVRREGIYCGMTHLLGRLSGIFQTQTLNFILVITGYSAALSVAQQAPAVEQGLRVALAVIPSAALLIGVMLLWFYPLRTKLIH